MWSSVRRSLLVAAAALLVVGVTASISHAQVRVLPNSQAIVNPYFRVAPGLPLNQAAFNIRVMGRAYSSVPPWIYGYNPYPSPIYVTPPYVTPVYPFSNPYLYGTNPYTYPYSGIYPY